MNDQTFDRVVTAASIVLGLYWFLMGRKNAPIQIVPPAPGLTDPNLVNYMQQTGGNPPIQVAGANVNVNIANQGLQFLNSSMMPLFGFVGMAQGITVA